MIINAYTHRFDDFFNQWRFTNLGSTHTDGMLAFILQFLRRSFWRICHRSRLQVAVGCAWRWTTICSRLERHDSGRLLSQLRMEFEEEEALLWPSSCSSAHATETSRSRNCTAAFWSCVFTPTAGRRFLLMMPAFFDGTDCICRSCELLTGTLYKTNETYLPTRIVSAILWSRCHSCELILRGLSPKFGKFLFVFWSWFFYIFQLLSFTLFLCGPYCR